MNNIIRALRRFVINLTGKNKTIFFLILILICILAICLGIYSQFFYEYSDTDPLMLGIHIGTKKTSEEYTNLKANFSNIFTNELHINSESVRVDKIETSKSIVYTGYNIQNIDENYYNVNLKLPILNINNDVAKNINSSIEERFYDEANKIMRNSKEHVSYNVSYVGYINKDVVSIAIKETAKYGNNPEKVTITTFNYSIPDKKEVTLDKLIELKNTDKETVQKSINTSIKTAYENANAIANEFGTETIFQRNLKDKMYKIDNAKSYFLTDDGYVYIV